MEVRTSFIEEQRVLEVCDGFDVLVCVQVSATDKAVNVVQVRVFQGNFFKDQGKLVCVSALIRRGVCGGGCCRVL